jgi:hypothetical protein
MQASLLMTLENRASADTSDGNLDCVSFVDVQFDQGHPALVAK